MTSSRRPQRCILLSCVWLAAACVSTSTYAQSQPGVGTLLQANTTSREPLPEVAALEQALLELERRPNAEVARTWLDAARGALARARTLHRQGQAEASARATEIASAALAAAGHTLMRHGAEAELAAAQRRKAAATSAAEAARDALTHAQAQGSQIGETP